MPPTVVYDACVLYSATVRDLLMHLAVGGVVAARWTERIHDEWTRSLRTQRPDLSADQLARTRAQMNRSVRDCLVTGYDDLIDGLTLPDPDDRHVLAAAIRAGAGAVVTLNLKDFPPAALAPHGVEAVHPDDFAAGLLERYPDEVCAAVRLHRESLKKPPKTHDEYLASLAHVGLPRTAAALAGLRGRW